MMSGTKKLHTLPDGDVYAVGVERVDDRFRVTCDSPSLEASVAGGAHGLWTVVTGQGSYETRVTREDGEIHVLVEGEKFSFGVGALPAASDPAKRVSARAEVKAPMPGKVVKLLVSPGDTVVSGQGILLFEAMKMQNEIKSPQDGVISEIVVEEGQAAEARDRLFVILRT